MSKFFIEVATIVIIFALIFSAVFASIALAVNTYELFIKAIL